MAESPVPLLFWTGYTSVVLVSSAYFKKWTVLASDSPVTRVFPRRWLDISGLKIVDLWEAALRAAMGIIIFRPGISHVGSREFLFTFNLCVSRLSCDGDFDLYMIGKK
jgi:hypothetical protein